MTSIQRYSTPTLDRDWLFLRDVATLRDQDLWHGGEMASLDLWAAPLPADLIDRIVAGWPPLEPSGPSPNPWAEVNGYARDLYMSKALGYRGPFMQFILRAPHELGRRKDDLDRLQTATCAYLKQLFGENADFWFQTTPCTDIHVDIRGCVGIVGSSRNGIRKTAKNAGAIWNRRHSAYELSRAGVVEADGRIMAPATDPAGIRQIHDRLRATEYTWRAAQQVYENHVRVIEALRPNGAPAKAA